VCLEIFSPPGRLIPTSQVDRLSSRATQIVVSWGWTGDEIRGAVSQVITGLLGWLLATSAYQSSAVVHLHGISEQQGRRDIPIASSAMPAYNML
jgi:hypothetical protein